jgi:hypothetical protein
MLAQTVKMLCTCSFETRQRAVSQWAPSEVPQRRIVQSERASIGACIRALFHLITYNAPVRGDMQKPPTCSNNRATRPRGVGSPAQVCSADHDHRSPYHGHDYQNWKSRDSALGHSSCIGLAGLGHIVALERSEAICHRAPTTKSRKVAKSQKVITEWYRNVII